MPEERRLFNNKGRDSGIAHGRIKRHRRVNKTFIATNIYVLPDATSGFKRISLIKNFKHAFAGFLLDEDVHLFRIFILLHLAYFPGGKQTQCRIQIIETHLFHIQRPLFSLALP
jgi:hypothetical protein